MVATKPTKVKMLMRRLGYDIEPIEIYTDLLKLNMETLDALHVKMTVLLAKRDSKSLEEF